MLLAVFSEAVRDTTLNLRITHKTFICEFSLFHSTIRYYLKRNLSGLRLLLENIGRYQ